MNRKKREQLILDAAVRAFSREGYSKTSVSEIIQEAQVARGTFYLYFKGKDELFNTLLDQLMSDLAADVRKIGLSVEPSSLEPLRHYRQQASGLMSTLSRNRLLLKIISVESASFENSTSARLTHFYEQLVDLVRDGLDLSIKAGNLRSLNTSVVARCLFGCIKEMVANWIVREDFEMETSIEGLIDYLLHGLSPSSPMDSKPATHDEEKPLARQNLNQLH